MKTKTYSRILLKFWRKDGKTTTYPYSTRIRRAMARLRLGQWVKTYARVEYGEGKTNFAKTIVYSDGSVTKPIEMFYNDATFTDKTEALETVTTFWEEADGQ